MQETNPLDSELQDTGVAGLFDLLIPLLQRWRLVLFGPLLVGGLALGITYLIPNTYTSRTVFLPPQQQQSVTASALAQLGALSGFVGAAAGIRIPGDQYVALLQSQTVADRLITSFDLMRVYEAEYRYEARKELAENSRINLGRKDGLITIEVDDHDPQRAAHMANRYVEELRRLANDLALTEAQQRRTFLEQQLSLTQVRLKQAQQALQDSGLGQGILKADARVAADAYARLRAEVTAAEIRLQALRVRLADNTPEVQQAVATLQALRTQLARSESGANIPMSGPDYISKYREFKYQEALFELFARQYEMARVDESREGPLIQVVDEAVPAERRARPKRALVAVLATLVTEALLIGIIFLIDSWSRQTAKPGRDEALGRLREAWRGRR